MTEKITFTITTCDRLDLLEKTIESFNSTNNHPIDQWLMVNDSGDKDIHKILLEKYPYFEFIFNEEKIGLSKSLDLLWNKSRNDFIFHCEDDWFFDSNNNFLSESIQLLLLDTNINQVNIRHEYDNPHKPIDIVYTINNIEYKIMEPNFMGVWNGYSWNPGLRRKSDYITMFPKGVSEFKDEILCCEHSKKHNYKTVILKNTACYHIGYNRHTNNFLI